jgi:hypothetical protein
MSLVDLVRQLEGGVELLPPLSAAEIEAFATRLPCPLPAEVRELLSYCSGLSGELGDIVAEVGFTGVNGFGLEGVFRHALDIAGDGAGNYWVLDLTHDSTSWGPVFYACHDAPVILFQSESFAHFLEELVKLADPSQSNELQYVHEDGANVWLDNPGMLTQEQCLASDDPDLAAFARTLDASWLIKDLRRPALGDGFTWGRYRGEPVLARYGEKRIFAYREPERKGFWQRVRGR